MSLPGYPPQLSRSCNYLLDVVKEEMKRRKLGSNTWLHPEATLMKPLTLVSLLSEQLSCCRSRLWIVGLVGWSSISVTGWGKVPLELSWDVVLQKLPSHHVYCDLYKMCVNYSLPFYILKAFFTEIIASVWMKHWAQHLHSILCSINVCGMNNGIRSLSSQGFYFSYSILLHNVLVTFIELMFEMKIDCMYINSLS